ncbi:ornithine cyclodeaminase family protein [Aurantibacter crassamenti]|uniref:ornithine cyclodeaminase family protein n=1 Tax=Aurantibacter crassamenti TaxID=1837375 RepID=UPI00193A942A|nr:ornithine cyclodeaminase family protein [Aurantibacter crassamenti]MBM1106807.1 ornithine cyclodeaminase family protein [Aurantibacter crassamenti]
MKKETQKTLILSGDDVNAIVDKFGLNKLMDRLISDLTKAIESFDPQHTKIPIRDGFNYKGENPGLVEWMPLHQKGKEITIKVVGYHPRNPETHLLPTILSTISSYDTTTGHLKGLVDGVLLTALRTGATSAIASTYLADPKSKILGLIGCGAQAVTQLHAISRVFDLNLILINDIDSETMESFKNRCEMLDINAEIRQASLLEIVKESDIVCTSTSIEVGEGPLFENIDVNSKIHINAVGSDFPGKTELPLSLLKESIVVPDFLNQALVEGECQQLETSDIGPDLIDVIQNKESKLDPFNQKTVFDSTGWALEDQVVMNLFLELAEKFNVGTELEIENTSEDAKNPYHFMLKAVQV